MLSNSKGEVKLNLISASGLFQSLWQKLPCEGNNFKKKFLLASFLYHSQVQSYGWCDFLSWELYQGQKQVAVDIFYLAQTAENTGEQPAVQPVSVQ